MSEAKVGFLFKAASVIDSRQDNHVNNILKSYLMLRCNETTKGYGLPQRQFSNKSRCTHCFIEWNNNFDCKVVSLKLSKRQKKRIRDSNKKKTKKREEIINGNILEQTCHFCKQTTTTYLAKPNKELEKCKLVIQNEIKKEVKEDKEPRPIKTAKSLQSVTDVYSNSKEVFSLKNNNNTLQNTVKEPKIIKNNKKKKDKFAGLCKKAVLSAAKMKDEKDKNNLIKLFLKPSQ